MIKNKLDIVKFVFLLTPFFLLALQLIFTLSTREQIRYEELAESVRNVWWLQNGIVYDGVSSNIGWYGTLLLMYKFFGFSVFAAKYFRLALAVISLVCLAAVLKKYLGTKRAFVPLLFIGLSPTLLFFNTLQSSFGTDLQYIPIILFLILSLNFQKTLLSFTQQFTLGALTMIAWMSYPTFVFYLPILAIIYTRHLCIQSSRKKLIIVKNFFVVFVAFLTPLVISILSITNRQLLFFDKTLNSGLFRGAGSFTFDMHTAFKNLLGVANDLFISPSSYYYEVAQGDFSQYYPIIPLILLLSVGIYLAIKNNKLRLPLLLAFSLMLLNILVTSFTNDPSGKPGIRRFTPSLAAVYVIFTIVWYWASKNWKENKFKKIAIGALFIILVHHIIVFPLNLSSLKNDSPYKYSHVFGTFGTPEKSLDILVNIAKTQDLKLFCTDSSGNPAYCRYVEAYSAVAGFCTWNNLKCHDILGYDNKTEKFIPLTTKLWEDYYWEH